MQSTLAFFGFLNLLLLHDHLWGPRVWLLTGNACLIGGW